MDDGTGPPAMDLDSWCDRQLQLLSEEKDAEVAEKSAILDGKGIGDLVAKGVALVRLVVEEPISTGLGGRALVTLKPQHAVHGLTAHRFTPGDIVSLRHGESKGGAEGIVYRASEKSVVVAFDEVPELLDPPLSLMMLANDITFQRRRDAITNLRKNQQVGETTRMVNVLFHGLPPCQAPPRAMPAVPAERRLNESQEAAIEMGLRSQDVAVIHGPPGTGKTTTVVELIRRAVQNGEKVLACAPSNIAVDNMVERLAALKVNVVRVGHPARLLPEVLEYSLDALCASGDAAAILKDVRKDMDLTLKKSQMTKNKVERRSLRGEMKELRKEVRRRERKAVDQIISGADVVCCTTAGAAAKKLNGKEGGWDLVVIDECAQALEADCWIPLARGRRCVLAGDHQQLPPTITSASAKKELEFTLMDRVVKGHPGVVLMLEVQYRMHATISAWSSAEFYGGNLRADPSVASHTLAGVPGVSPGSEDGNAAAVLIDTAGCDCLEDEVREGQSKRNAGEGEVVVAHARRLLDEGLKPHQIAIITPYNAQVELLREKLRGADISIEVNTVDGFQGREKEAVVISLVRSNPRGEVGFLAEPRRLNVAITRARRHLAVVGDTDTLRHNDFLGPI